MKKVNIDLMLDKKTESHFRHYGSKTNKVAQKVLIFIYLNLMVRKTTNVAFFELHKGMQNTKNYVDMFFVFFFGVCFNVDSLPKQVFGLTYKDTLKFQAILRFDLEYIKKTLIKYENILQVLLIKIYVIFIP